ncbi:ATP-dependent RNA helicase [Perkinsus chesapeaki]|uniref:ATP-dependent RNA helicase n=1 Tax=Perkinsus chesapeaki TaxID=330153 RepID=A0A7J6MYT6_PERCH|nr:ATP-dependent RNA helicase [Perkinsus chesapeaki]
MLRCRGGDFIYSKEEMEEMLNTLKAWKDNEDIHLDGVVFGAISKDHPSSPDIHALLKIVNCAFPWPVTFHKAIDFMIPAITTDTTLSITACRIIDELDKCGVRRILTSGLHLTADEGKDDRLKKLEQFRNASCGVLVTTDLASRGLDLPNVDTVIHVNCPRVLELFIHRSGRTARAGRKGNCIIIRTPSEDGAWRRTLDAVNVVKVDDIIMNSRDIAFIKHLLSVVNEYEGAQHKEQRENKEKAWMRKMAEDADLPISDIEEQDDDDEGEEEKTNIRIIYEKVKTAI